MPLNTRDISNNDITITVDTRANTAIKIEANKPDIIVYDKKRKMITIIEIGITSQNQLSTVETEKKRKYDILANNLSQIHKMKTRIIPWVMTWDGKVTKTHKYYLKELGISNIIEAYMQSLVIRRTLESISLDHRRGEEIAQDTAHKLKVTSETVSCNEETVNQTEPVRTKI